MVNVTKKMPALFVGHGSPMNAIEVNSFSTNWSKIAEQLPKPEAILSVSAHWTTDGTRVLAEEYPKTIYDMYGFPDELYRVVYKAKGAPELANMTKTMISKPVMLDNSWGFDHGTWSVLNKMFPKADIPVYQLSIDNNASAEEHFLIGQEISSLREKGVLLLGSGNVVHNLARLNWGMDGGYPWAQEFDDFIKNSITSRQYQNVIDYRSAGKASELAFFTTEHFYPLLYVLGASGESDSLKIFNDSCILGSLSMTCYLFE